MVSPLRPLGKIRPRRTDPKEKAIEQKVCQHAREKGCLVYKFVSPSHAGVPDRIFVGPGGFIWLIEFKRLNAKTSKHQEREIARLRAHHTYVWIVDTVERGKTIVDACIQAEFILNARVPLPDLDA